MDNAGVPNFTPGEKSREKYLQAEREKNVLAFIFLTRERYYFNKMIKKIVNNCLFVVELRYCFFENWSS